MRISEKTIEINFSSKLNYYYNNNIIWFGLTQKQEAKLGFDICCKLKGRLYIFQLKAISKILKNGTYQFKTPHHQIIAMQKLSHKSARSVFYVLPDFGNTSELMKLSKLDNYWLLDTKQISRISEPTCKNGKIRKNKTHYINMEIPFATIYSKPVKVDLTALSGFSNFYSSSGLLTSSFNNDFDNFWDMIKDLDKSTKIAVEVPEQI